MAASLAGQPLRQRRPRTSRRLRRLVQVRTLRLWTGLLLMAFVASHLTNHALGLISLEAMEAGRIVFLSIWRSQPIEGLLLVSLLLHIGLAMFALYSRRSLRMPPAEALRLLLGLATPPLLAIHILGTAVANEFFGVDDTYAFVLWLLQVGGNSGRQILLLSIVWLHASIGIYFWLRLKPWFHRAAPYLYGFALLLPVVATLGYIDGGREVAALAAQEGWVQELFQAINAPTEDQVQAIFTAQRVVLLVFAALIALSLAARLVRQVVERRRGVVNITYPNGRRVQITRGPSVLDASRFNGIPHASVCGGRGRCSTCRIRINEGVENLEPPSGAEQKVLDRILAAPDVRLACQLKPSHDLSVTPLLLPNVGPEEGHAKSQSHQGQEQEIAVLFADIRDFTTISETKLPYDVVFILNSYFRSMGEAIEAGGGRVDKFIGDGIMALFGVDAEPRTACIQAIRAVRRMSAQLEDLNSLLAADLPAPLKIGIGVHVGPAIVGEMGYADSTSVTAIGDTVNTASRLESMTKEFGAQLIVSQRVVDLAGIDVEGFPLEERPIRGRAETLTIRVVNDARDLPEPMDRPAPTKRRGRAKAPA